MYGIAPVPDVLADMYGLLSVVGYAPSLGSLRSPDGTSRGVTAKALSRTWEFERFQHVGRLYPFNSPRAMQRTRLVKGYLLHGLSVSVPC